MRPIEEYHPDFERVLAMEWEKVKRDFLISKGYPIERDYGYVRERYYSDAKANARAVIRYMKGQE